jgi:endonuclease YncB( thermonuclease family)
MSNLTYVQPFSELQPNSCSAVRHAPLGFLAFLSIYARAGAKARDTVQEMLREPFVVWTRWASAAGRGQETRYHAFVEAGGERLAEVLVGRGLARTKGIFPNLPAGEKAKAYVERLEALEREARQKRLGIWGSPAEKRAETQTKSLQPI